LPLSGLLAALLTQVMAQASTQPAGLRAPPPGRAILEATSAPSADDVQGYCSYVTGISKSARALLEAPELFGYFAMNNSVNSVLSADSFPLTGYTYIPTYEVAVAAQYHFGHLFASFENRDRAAADCQRYHYVSALHTVVQAFQEPEATIPALQARAAVLNAALPRAAEILASVQGDLREAKATAEELNATELRVDALRADAQQTAEALEAQAQRVDPPSMSAAELLAKRDAAEKNLAYHEVQEQRAGAWDILVRGGYDRIYGVRDTLPLFVSVGLVFNFGWFFQADAARLAEKGRRAWVDVQMEGLDQRVHIALARARAQLNADSKRYQETTVLLADLEEQMKSVLPLGGPKVKRYRDYLWFDLTRVRAENAFLKANVTELQSWLREGVAQP